MMVHMNEYRQLLHDLNMMWDLRVITRAEYLRVRGRIHKAMGVKAYED